MTDSTLPKTLPAFNGVADLGQVDEDDVAEGVLRVVGDADLAGLALDLDPLMLFACSGKARDRP